MSEEATDSSKPKKKKAPLSQEVQEKVQEVGGPQGPEPTRYGDWQFKGRVSDF